jgi:hypothetical protein
VTDAGLLVSVLREPARVQSLGSAELTALIGLARAESLIGSLAYRLQGLKLPHGTDDILGDARRDAEQARRQALWEAEMARRALAPLDVPVVLLKGTAYAAAGLAAGIGRSIGDLDVLVPRGRLDEVQEALLAAGWEWVKEDSYDDLYYPPLDA